MTTPWQKEWNRMQRQEYEYLQKGRFRKESRLNRLLEKHIPDALQDKLDLAFSKAFELIFEKGGRPGISAPHLQQSRSRRRP